MVRVLLLFLDGHELVEEVVEVDPSLDEVGIEAERLLVARDEGTVDRARTDLLLQFLHAFRSVVGTSFMS